MLDLTGINKRTIVIVTAILLISLIAGKFITQYPFIVLIFVIGIVVSLVTIINTDAAIVILIFSMLLSPEYKLIEVPQRIVVLRVDDLLLIVVFFTWLAKMAVNKKLALLKHTPLNRPIMAYLSVYIFSTALGVMRGTINIVTVSFYILKFIEYFLIYFMITNSVRSKKQVRVFIAFFMITCAIVCAYTIPQIGVEVRTSAPFEGEKGEPNTLGGYLIIVFAVCMGIFLRSSKQLWRFFSAALACFIVPPFLFSLSRGSYLSSFFMYPALIILTRKKRALLVAILMLSVIILLVTMPESVTRRVRETFVPGQRVYKPFGTRIYLDESTAIRIEGWKSIAFTNFPMRPFLGYGVTGVGLVDSQYPRILGETGGIGLWIFLWLLTSLWKQGIYSYNHVKDDWMQGLISGYLAAYVGLLIHSFAANTFIIVRIMEPFWFLTAIVAVLPQLESSEEKA